MSDIYTEIYTEKSFVVRGNTIEYKDNLKNLGGKWNSNLKDKKTGEKFGAWLFWNEKKKEIDGWINNGCNDIKTKQIAYSSIEKISDLQTKITNIENMLRKILNLLEKDEIAPCANMRRRLL